MVWNERLRSVSVALIGVAVLVTPLSAQTKRPPGAQSELEERSALEAEARDAEAQNRTSEAWLLRTRLQRGDFQDGDRIVVKLLGSTTFNDTITVRAGKMLPLPRMDDLPLDGVLRSELNARLSSHLARYLRDSSVRATPLLRLAVLGQVRSPGYYYTSADVLLSDVIMKAGGPSTDADMNKAIIRRGGETIWNAQATQTAVSDGLSLDRLHLRAGDEIFIPEQHHFNWAMAAQIGLSLLAVAAAFTRFH